MDESAARHLVGLRVSSLGSRDIDKGVPRRDRLHGPGAGGLAYVHEICRHPIMHLLGHCSALSISVGFDERASLASLPMNN